MVNIVDKKEKIKEYYKNYYQKNKEYYKNNYQKNKDKIKIYNQQFEVKQRRKNYNKKYFQQPEVKERIKKLELKNKDYISNIKRFRRKLNYDIVRKKEIEYNKKNIEKYREYARIGYYKHLEENREYARIKYQENKKYICQQNRLKRKLNKKDINQKELEKYYSNIQYKLRLNISTRIRLTLKGKNKSESTMNLIGCTIEELKIYLEKQFKEKMTWENHGIKGWHIDHIRPCCLFDLTKEEEQKKCFHYSNLQPLWWEENLRKGRTNTVEVISSE